MAYLKEIFHYSLTNRCTDTKKGNHSVTESGNGIFHSLMRLMVNHIRNYKLIMNLQKRSYFTYPEFLSICACFIVSYLQSKTYASYMLKTIFTSAIIDLPISCLLVVMFYLHKGDITSKLGNKILVEIENLSPYLFMTHYIAIAYCRAVLLKITDINISVLLVPISFCVSIMLTHLYRNLIEDKIKCF